MSERQSVAYPESVSLSPRCAAAVSHFVCVSIVHQKPCGDCLLHLELLDSVAHVVVVVVVVGKTRQTLATSRPASEVESSNALNFRYPAFVK